MYQYIILYYIHIQFGGKWMKKKRSGLADLGLRALTQPEHLRGEKKYNKRHEMNVQTSEKNVQIVLKKHRDVQFGNVKIVKWNLSKQSRAQKETVGGALDRWKLKPAGAASSS